MVLKYRYILKDVITSPGYIFIGLMNRLLSKSEAKAHELASISIEEDDLNYIGPSHHAYQAIIVYFIFATRPSSS